MKMNELPKFAPIEDANKVLTLLCCLLEYFGGLTEAQLFEIAAADELVAPFKFSDALAVIESRGLAEISGNVYRLSPAGKTWLGAYENSLTGILRRKILQNGEKVLQS
jgi:hypothetical protein